MSPPSEASGNCPLRRQCKIKLRAVYVLEQGPSGAADLAALTKNAFGLPTQGYRFSNDVH
jgi:hypothetical protein